MTRHMKVGVIAAPERAADIISRLINQLPNKFSKIIDSDIAWEITSVVDPLTGAAETAGDILYNASCIKQNQGWDYAICLTDLPIFHKNDIVAADISFTYQVAQISLPAYGWPPMQQRISRTIIHLLGCMHEYSQTNWAPMGQSQSHVNARGEQIRQSAKRPYKQRFPIMPILRQDNPEIGEQMRTGNSNEKSDSPKDTNREDAASPHWQGNGKSRKRHVDNEPNNGNIDTRFLIYPRIFGLLRLMLGMTFANNPLKIMSSFKSVIAIAFTTGAFALIFPTIWKWGQIFSSVRLTIMTVAAILGLVVWIMAVHRLWEYPSSKNKPSIRYLYNLATISTLIIDVTAYYAVLYVLFFTAAAIFIPPDYLESVIPDSNDPTIISYMRVAWVEASIATIVSAMGAGLEDDKKLRNITYGYRQRRRYKEVDHANK